MEKQEKEGHSQFVEFEQEKKHRIRMRNALNKRYKGKYEFKVYQVRKPRTGWETYDAGVYSYVNDSDGNQYTIEFDLHTNLSIPRTDLKLSVWGEI